MLNNAIHNNLKSINKFIEKNVKFGPFDDKNFNSCTNLVTKNFEADLTNPTIYNAETASVKTDHIYDEIKQNYDEHGKFFKHSILSWTLTPKNSQFKTSLIIIIIIIII